MVVTFRNRFPKSAPARFLARASAEYDDDGDDAATVVSVLDVDILICWQSFSFVLAGWKVRKKGQK